MGLPKSGSTYLQTVLGNNRAALREVGHVYPYVRQEGMFHAAVEMAGLPSRWGLQPEAISGTFAHLLRRGRRLGGTVMISHEIFGSATRDQIAHMAPLLEGFEVHLVVTVRDLGRTATAEWQEQVKNGNPRSFEAFVGDLMSHLPEDLVDTTSFWRSQNLRNLLERWQTLVPAERIHIVTCPRGGSAPDLLWRRFAEAVELPPDAVDLSLIPPRNESLGTAQIAFLRRVVGALDGRLAQPWYSRVAKRWFAQTLLGGVGGSDEAGHACPRGTPARGGLVGLDRGDPRRSVPDPRRPRRAAARRRRRLRARTPTTPPTPRCSTGCRAWSRTCWSAPASSAPTWPRRSAATPPSPSPARSSGLVWSS